MLVTVIRPNLRRLIKGWDQKASEGLRRYVRTWSSVDSRARAPQTRIRREPVWLLLPEWLDSTYRKNQAHRPRGTKFLQDVLWGQFALFLAIKIQDDLFDGQLADRSLIWVADEFLLEAERAFTLHFRGSREFWSFYNRSVTTTVRAIHRVDKIQSGNSPRYRTIARLYPSMYAVCKIATYAVCLRRGKPEHFRRAARFLDELTRTGQVLDDLEDIGEDLERGRVNAAAAFLSPRARPGRKANQREIGDAMLQTDALQRFFRLLRRRVRSAEKTIGFLRHPELTRYLESYIESLDGFEEYFIGLKTGLD